MAGYFICCQAIGEALGPFASSMLERSIEFRNTQKVLCILVTLFLIVYLLSFGLYGFFKYAPHVKSNQKDQIDLEDLVFELAEPNQIHDDNSNINLGPMTF